MIARGRVLATKDERRETRGERSEKRERGAEGPEARSGALLVDSTRIHAGTGQAIYEQRTPTESCMEQHVRSLQTGMEGSSKSLELTTSDRDMY